MKRREFLAAAALCLPVLSRQALAQTSAYPNKPVRLIVPFAPGGTVDFMARAISAALGKQLGQTVIVENKGGAGGAIGTMEMVRAAPDGYTLAMVSPSVTAANPAINPKVPYNPVTDVTPIINVAASPHMIAIHPSFPARNYKDFLAELKRHPGRYSYASSGTGGILHLQMEYYKSATGTFITHIPYRGAGPAVQDVVAGQLAIAYDAPPSLMPFVKEGMLIPIAICAPQRLKDLPNVPTFKEVGVDGLSRMAHYGILGPKGMPRDLVDKINAATKRALDEPGLRARIEGTGSVVVASTPEEFAAEIKADYELLKRVVAERKLTLE